MCQWLALNKNEKVHNTHFKSYTIVKLFTHSWSHSDKKLIFDQSQYIQVVGLKFEIRTESIPRTAIRLSLYLVKVQIRTGNWKSVTRIAMAPVQLYVHYRAFGWAVHMSDEHLMFSMVLFSFRCTNFEIQREQSWVISRSFFVYNLKKFLQHLIRE